MPPGNWLKLSSSSAWSMRIPILVETEICSSVILRFSRSSFSFAPKEGNPVSRFRQTANGFYSVERQSHRPFQRFPTTGGGRRERRELQILPPSVFAQGRNDKTEIE